MQSPLSDKTALQLLIEARDPKRRDVRDFCTDVLAQTGLVESVAAEISKITGKAVGAQTLRNWFDGWGVDWRRTRQRAGVAP